MQPLKETFMLTRRLILGIAAVAALYGSTAVAGTSQPYDQAAFEGAQGKGKPILVEIAASWCPTCKAQEPILNGLLDGKFKDMIAFRVDFDSQKDVVRALGAQSQSTLIVFAGANEVGRSVGDTNPNSIEELLGRAK
jgi:thioredoxin 1